VIFQRPAFRFPAIRKHLQVWDLGTIPVVQGIIFCGLEKSLQHFGKGDWVEIPSLLQARKGSYPHESVGTLSVLASFSPNVTSIGG
jgi:hypothetical protein